MTVDVRAFTDALKSKLKEHPSIAPEKEWIAGGVTKEGGAVVLYRAKRDGPVLARHWDLDRFALLFGTEDARVLADAAYTSEIAEPEGRVTHLDVDWAHGLTDKPSEVLWAGELSDKG